MEGEDKKLNKRTQVSWQEDTKLESELNRRNSYQEKRRLINLQQPSSSNIDQQQEKQNQSNDNKQSQSWDIPSEDNINTPTNKDQGKSASSAERRAKAVAKRQANQAKKLARRKARQATRKVAKKIVQAGIKLLGKGLAAIGSVIGLPAILIILGAVILIILLMMISSYSIGTGAGIDELGEEASELHEYIKIASENTVDMSKSEQIPYMVPPELLSAVVQIDSHEKEYDFEGRANPLGDYKKIIDLFAEKLKPEFTYESFEEYTETRSRSCGVDEDGVETCSSWSYSKSVRHVERLVNVDAWNGVANITYKQVVDDWSGGHESQSREVFHVEDQFEFTYGFDKLDRVLEEQGYKLGDKETFELIYEFTTGREMFYIRWLNGETISMGYDEFFFHGDVIPGEGVPAQFMPYYLDAAKKYNVPWEYIAAIHRVETVFSSIPNMVSSAGAIGHTQFMPCTWVGWSYSGCKGTKGNASIPDNVLTNPAMIKKYGGYGQDGNGDGKSDPWDIEDAIHSTAYYLQKNGINSNPQKAIRAYNHSTQYVNDVMGFAQKFKNEATYVPKAGEGASSQSNPNGFIRPTNGPITSGYGSRWGGFHFGIDFGRPHGGNVPIWAAADGVVSRSYYSNSYGNAVFVKHTINGRTYETVYAHMRTRFVSEGQRVRQGDVIGYMGNTGHVVASGGGDGTHLHFEVHIGSWNMSKSNSINPITVIPN